MSGLISRDCHHVYVDMTRLSFVSRLEQACICVLYSWLASVMLSLLVAMLLTGAARRPSGLIGSGMDGWIGVHDGTALRSLPWTFWG